MGNGERYAHTVRDGGSEENAESAEKPNDEMMTKELKKRKEAECATVIKRKIQ